MRYSDFDDMMFQKMIECDIHTARESLKLLNVLSLDVLMIVDHQDHAINKQILKFLCGIESLASFSKTKRLYDSNIK